MLPAASQGAIGIDCLSDNSGLLDLLEPVNHGSTYIAAMAERAFLEAVGGDCHSPVAANALVGGNGLTLRAEILAQDGSERCAGQCQCDGDGIAAAVRLAAELLENASPELRAVFGK